MSELIGEKNIMNAMCNEYNSNYYATIDGACLYVDYFNNRLKLTGFDNLSEDCIKELIDFAKSKQLGKIIVFCESKNNNILEKCGFIQEGIIKGFFKGTDAICFSYFIDIERATSKLMIAEEEILKEALTSNKAYVSKPNFEYCVRTACEKDVPQMVTLFKDVFATYPSPVSNEDYLIEAMKKRVLFKVAEKDGKIIGIASADMAYDNLNAEITDCATLPKYRGNGILPKLIIELEAKLIERGFITLYSLSRANNIGINKTLSKLKYEYNGRLINNCNICGGFEDMNVWTKNIRTV